MPCSRRDIGDRAAPDLMSVLLWVSSTYSQQLSNHDPQSSIAPQIFTCLVPQTWISRHQQKIGLTD